MEDNNAGPAGQLKTISRKFTSAHNRQKNDSLVNAASGLGTYEDAAVHARPTIEHRLSDLELEMLYLQSDLSRRIVEELVDDTIRQGWKVLDAVDEKEIVEEPEHLDIREALKEAWYNARLRGGGAVAMISKTPDLSKPMKDSDQIVSLIALDIDECQPAVWNSDPFSARFTKPELYTVSPSNVDYSLHVIAPQFHHTRLLTLNGATLPTRFKRSNNGWGDSIMQSCWAPVRNFEQSEAAMANIIQRFEVATYSIAGLADILDDDDGREAILARMKLIQQTISMVRAAVVDKDAGEEYSRQFSTVNGLDTLWDRLAHSVAKSARMPMTKLFGMSPSGLATDDESGRAHWRQQIAAGQEQIRPLLEQYYRHCNGGKEVIIRFQPQDEATAREEAEISKMKAETREMYISMGAARPEEFRPKMVEEGEIANVDMEPDLEGDLESFYNEQASLPGELSDDVPGPAGEGDEGAGAEFDDGGEPGSEPEAF